VRAGSSFGDGRDSSLELVGEDIAAKRLSVIPPDESAQLLATVASAAAVPRDLRKARRCRVTSAIIAPSLAANVV
jgi:hypothetical protein